MEQWLKLRNVVNSIQYDTKTNFLTLDIKALNQKSQKRKQNKEEERQVLGLGFGDMAEKCLKRRIFRYI